ncbi:MAG TPA: hypothetical protein VNB29_11530, partial [Chthoniobacterales bacterium]|nr:hypothetical protein [Chthoniobacterales bacterium]
WKNGTRLGLFALIGGTTGMILTKETYFIHLGCFALAIASLLAWQKLSPSRPTQPLAAQSWTWLQSMWAVFLGIFAIIFFYSGTFLNWPGVTGLYEAYAAWGHTNITITKHKKTNYNLHTFNIHGWKITLNYYWLALMARYEWPALVGLVACVRLLWPAPAQLRYLAIYGAGALVAYSIIPYKTPWLLLVLLWPFLFTFGALIEEILAALKWNTWAETAAPFVGSALIAISLMKSAKLNFINYAALNEPYVYVQTSPEIRRLTGPMLALARQDPSGYQLDGQFMLDSYYPLPWMLGDFSNLSYNKGDYFPQRLFGDVITTEKSKSDRVEAALHEPYYRRDYRLRDAQEDCVVWFRVAKFRKLLQGEKIVGPSTPLMTP